jgi:hypothetical protein
MTLAVLGLATSMTNAQLSVMQPWAPTVAQLQQRFSNDFMEEEEEEEEEEVETMLIMVPPEPTISFQDTVPGVLIVGEGECEMAQALCQDVILHFITYLVTDVAPADFPGFRAYCPEVCPYLVSAFEAHVILLNTKEPLFMGSVLPIVVLDNKFFVAQNRLIYMPDIP